MTGGFNPLRWKCAKDGCFNEKRRAKIEAFSDCFPRRINFGDVDGMVEYGGSFCLLEWKGEGGTVHTGQRLSYVRFTKNPGYIVFIVTGNAETMAVTGYSIFWSGKQGNPIQADLQALKVRIRKWVRYIDEQTEKAVIPARPAAQFLLNRQPAGA